VTAIKEHHQKILEIVKDLDDHGYGELKIAWTKISPDRIKVTVACGRSYVYFINREVKFASEPII